PAVNQTLTASGAATSSIAGSATVAVAAAAATHFQVSAPASATAGSAFSVTVTALDQFNNTAAGYRGTAHFTKTDGGAGSAVPAPSPFLARAKAAHTIAHAVTPLPP